MSGKTALERLKEKATAFPGGDKEQKKKQIPADSKQVMPILSETQFVAEIKKAYLAGTAKNDKSKGELLDYIQKKARENFRVWDRAIDLYEMLKSNKESIIGKRGLKEFIDGIDGVDYSYLTKHKRVRDFCIELNDPDVRWKVGLQNLEDIRRIDLGDAKTTRKEQLRLIELAKNGTFDIKEITSGNSSSERSVNDVPGYKWRDGKIYSQDLTKLKKPEVFFSSKFWIEGAKDSAARKRRALQLAKEIIKEYELDF